jgi:hypothetical protein
MHSGVQRDREQEQHVKCLERHIDRHLHAMRSATGGAGAGLLLLPARRKTGKRWASKRSRGPQSKGGQHGKRTLSRQYSLLDASMRRSCPSLAASTMQTRGKKCGCADARLKSNAPATLKRITRMAISAITMDKTSTVTRTPRHVAQNSASSSRLRSLRVSTCMAARVERPILLREPRSSKKGPCAAAVGAGCAPRRHSLDFQQCPPDRQALLGQWTMAVSHEPLQQPLALSMTLKASVFSAAETSAARASSQTHAWQHPHTGGAPPCGASSPCAWAWPSRA